MDESEVHRELELKGLQPYYDRIVEQLASLDQKAQAMIGLEGLLLALMAVFSSSIPNNQPARAAVRASMVILLASALCSLLVMRIRYGTTILARSKTVEEGLAEYRSWRSQAQAAPRRTDTTRSRPLRPRNSPLNRTTLS